MRLPCHADPSAYRYTHHKQRPFKTKMKTDTPNLPLRCLSIDVEDYYQIESAYHVIPKSDWDHWPARVERNTDLLLELFARHGRKGTFFVLGSMARKHPTLVRRIVAGGHEIASHGTMHDRLHRLNAESFREDLHASKVILEDQAQQPVIGYRAPTFSVTPQTAWAIDVLHREGFQYDASIFPVHHPLYGIPGAPDQPFYVRGHAQGATLLEVPALTWKVGKKKLAVAGGGYFRLLPLWFMQRGLQQAAQQHRPAVLYFHPWEFDADLPRMPLKFTGRLRTYTGLKRAAHRLEKIMQQPARWCALREVLDELHTMAKRVPTWTLKE